VARSWMLKPFSTMALFWSGTAARMAMKKGEERKDCVEERTRSHSPEHWSAGSAVGFSACSYTHRESSLEIQYNKRERKGEEYAPQAESQGPQ